MSVSDEQVNELIDKMNKLMDHCKWAQDTMNAMKPQIEEYSKVISVVGDYLKRIKAYRDNPEENTLPMSDVYMQMITSIVARRLF